MEYLKSKNQLLILKIYGWNLAFLFLTLISMPSFADEIDNIYQSANGRLSKQGVLFLRQYYVAHNDPCERVSDVGGWWWKCTYQDGLVVYNCFRKCRGTIEAARLFLGLNTNKDCDSHTMINGERKNVCYPDQAIVIVRYHGPVIAIERLNECRE